MSDALIGGIVERKPTNAAPSAPTPSPSIGSSSTRGFPVAQHRSESAFARARRMKSEATTSRPVAAPIVLTSAPRRSPGSSTLGADGDTEDWREDMSNQNIATIASMSDEERQSAISEIFETLGDGVGDLLQRARAARARQQAEAAQKPVEARSPVTSESDDASNVSDTRSDPMSTSSRPSTPTRSAMRGSTPRSASRKVSFADVQPHDIHVYESHPPSPRKVLGLLGPSTGETGVPVQVLNNVAMSSQPTEISMDMTRDSSHGDAETIRAQYFPNEPLDNPSLEWLKQPEGGGYDDGKARFDLQGKLVPPDLTETLPTHLGLHHHAQGSRAGYTLDDILMLSHSTVPAQRTTMLGVMTGIIRQLANGTLDASTLSGTSNESRERIIEAAISAVGEKGSLGARAVDVVWEGLVGWDNETLSIPDVFLEDTSTKFESLSLHTLLQHIHTQLVYPSLPSEVLVRVLSILYRLSRHSLEMCKTLLSFDGLIPAVTRLFLPVRHGSMTHMDLPVQPNPLAITLLRALAASSRENAQSLIETADTLLRYVVALPSESSPLDMALAAETLRFYECLGRYGLYSNVASIASDHLDRVLTIAKTSPGDLLRSFLRLRETWIVCATDPHRTTPEHDILWSQVSSWGWGDDLLSLRRLFANDNTVVNADLHADLWGATAAWLEGCRTNSPRGGDAEKDLAIEVFLDGFREGSERSALLAAVQGLVEHLHELTFTHGSQAVVHATKAGDHARVVCQAVRLGLATAKVGFMSPLVQLLAEEPILNELLSTISRTSDLWSKHLQSKQYVVLRPVTALSYVLHLLAIAANAHNSMDLAASSAAVLGLLMVGDEDFAKDTIRSLLKIVSSKDLISSLDLNVAFNEERFLLDLEPFLIYGAGRKSTRISPTIISPVSIQECVTQVLPSSIDFANCALPTSADWPFWPLNDLLQSGTSVVFKQLPPAWDATEIDIVKASFLLAQIIQRSVALSALCCTRLELTRAEAVFACMRVFMLEHGQDSAGSSQEVFRDVRVEACMRDLLRPFTFAHAPVPPGQATNLEDVARRYLGQGVPFFQFYTDFVALYDAVSFGHPLFAALLIPPLSMSYAPDYRKLLFGEKRNVHVQLPNLLSDDPTAFMQPVEDNAEVIGAMLATLVRGAHTQGILRDVCVNHVACNIWPDLGHSTAPDERRRKLLKALVIQGDQNSVRDVALYSGYGVNGPVSADIRTRTMRWTWLQSLGDDVLNDRLRGLVQ